MRLHFRSLCGILPLVLVGILCGESNAVPPRVTAGRLRVELTRVVDRPVTAALSTPTVSIAFAPGDNQRMFLVEKGGFSPSVNSARVQMLNLNSGTYSTFLDLRSAGLPALNNISENGFLGLAFHPGFANPASAGYRKLYTYHSVATDPGATVDFSTPFTVSHHNVVTEWQVDANNPNIVDLTTRREVLREAHPTNPEHNAGSIAFDNNGYLFGAFGTPTVGTVQLVSAQDNTDIQGTIYRIDPLAPATTPTSTNPVSANGKYRIPADNPFISDPNALDEIYAYGFRNPYRFSVDSVTNKLIVGDVGQGATEEVDIVVPGGNYGWPYRQGNDPGSVPLPNPAPTLQVPVAEYSHSDGRAIVGGFVYRGPLTAIQGKYIYGDFSNNFFSGRGKLFISDILDANGNAMPPANVKVEQIIYGPSTCDKGANPSCEFEKVLLSFAADGNGDLYAVSVLGNRAIVDKITSAYYLPEGDFNEDGMVDARDYTLWRDTLGQSVAFGQKADGDRDGVIDDDDYNVWKAHFGESINFGSGGSLAAVPELSSISLSLAGACSAVIACQRRRSFDA